MGEKGFKWDMESNVNHPDTKVEKSSCRCNHEKLKGLTVVSAVLAVFAVSVSMYVMFTSDPQHGQACALGKGDRELLDELRSLRSMLAEHQSRDGDGEQLPLSAVLQMRDLPGRHVVKREVEGTTQKPPRREKGKRRGRGRGKGGGKGKGKRKGKGKKKKKQFLAAHYVPKFWKDLTEKEFEKSGIMNFFHQAEWVNTNNHIKSPAVVNNGKFEIQESGLYLLYSSVLFYDSKRKQSQAIMKNDHRLFKCMEGLDYIEGNTDKTPYQSKYKTCSITGVTYLVKGDKLSVDNMYENTTMDLSEDSTFFGLVQLLPSTKHK